MKNSLVSIIIPAYNAQNFIETAIRSCLSQTYTNLEIIVIDDGSQDSTAEIVKEMAKSDSRIIYRYQENQERSAARNNGLDAAKGEYVQFLDADDEILPSKIETQIKYLCDNEQFDAVFCPAIYVLHKQDRKYQNINVQCISDLSKNLIFQNIITINSVLLKSTKLRFKNGISHTEDWLFWLEYSMEHKIGFINKYLCVVNIHDSNTSLDKNKMIQGELNVLLTFQKLLGNRYDQELRLSILRRDVLMKFSRICNITKLNFLTIIRYWKFISKFLGRACIDKLNMRAGLYK